MKTAVEKLNPTLAKIEVEVPFAEFKPYLERTYKNLGAGEAGRPREGAGIGRAHV